MRMSVKQATLAMTATAIALATAGLTKADVRRIH